MILGMNSIQLFLFIDSGGQNPIPESLTYQFTNLIIGKSKAPYQLGCWSSRCSSENSCRVGFVHAQHPGYAASRELPPPDVCGEDDNDGNDDDDQCLDPIMLMMTILSTLSSQPPSSPLLRARLCCPKPSSIAMMMMMMMIVMVMMMMMVMIKMEELRRTKV